MLTNTLRSITIKHCNHMTLRGISEVARRWHVIFNQWNSLILTNQRNGLCLLGGANVSAKCLVLHLNPGKVN